MDEEIREMLEEEIKSEITNLSTLTPGEENHSTAVESLSKLYRLRLDELKVVLDDEEKYNRRMMDIDRQKLDCDVREKQFKHDIQVQEQETLLKKDQLTEQIKDRYFRLGLEVAGIILPLMFYASWMSKGFKFEETGTFTSTTFRGLFNRFRPTKK